MNDLQLMLRDLYLISGLNLSIFDIDENLITSYPEKKSAFCNLIDKNKEGLKQCHKCDHQAFETVKKTGKLHIYQCYFHLYEAVVPLYTYGVHTGYLMMGQTLTTSYFDKQYIKEKALLYIKDEKQLEEAINKISVHSKEQIYAFSNIIDICAKYITLTNRIESKKHDLALEVKKYIMLNYQKEITITQLCEHFYCSKSTLINNFKKAYGLTVHQYILDYRLNKSLELLKNNKLTILEISLNCGFTDSNYFSKAFKHKYQISPTEYRKEHYENTTTNR